MRLVLRRARGARSLLLATVTAALIAISFVVGLLAYGQQVLNSAAQATIAAAAPDERALLVRGAAQAGGTDLATKDAALRSALADGLGGIGVQVFSAGYGSGQQLTGAVGDAVGDDYGVVYANVMFLDELASNARLVSGAWPRPADQRDPAAPAAIETALPRAAAEVLGLAVGDRVPLLDRRTEETTELLVTGVWEPVDPTDPYWLLAPGLDSGVAPGTHSYGPFAIDRADFMSTFLTSGSSVGWVVRPDLANAGMAELLRLRNGRQALGDLTEVTGLHDSGRLVTRLDQLVDRLARADLVGRSALLTPVLLVIVLGGYALLLIAMLLTEQRRAETALIRARGASRPQLAGLSLREAALVLLPAVAAAPPLAHAVLGWVGLDAQGGTWRWGVAGAVGLVCASAMVGPSLRRSGTYIEELGARSRPSRFAFAQRVGIDAALVVLAALAWFQLRQYASPLTGTGQTIGIDPMLIAAPTIGVLAGAVLSLRLLPRITGVAERLVDRRQWPAAMVGTWQAGRRPHAGPVLLLALATATGTLAWSMLSTAQRSLVDQADFAVGADLRLVEMGIDAPLGRTAEVAALPGVAAVTPVHRTVLTVGADSVSTAVVGIDATRAAEVVRYRDDLGGVQTFAALAAARPELPVLPLPEGATRFAATVQVHADDYPPIAGPRPPTPVVEVTTTLVLLGHDGRLTRVPLGTIRSTEQPRRFEVALPADPQLALVRISVDVRGAAPFGTEWRLTDARVSDAGGVEHPLGSPADGWVKVDGVGKQSGDVPEQDGGMFVRQRGSLDFGVLPDRRHDVVPVLATPALLEALRAEVGETVRGRIGGAELDLHVVGRVAAVPGTQRSPSAMIADLPSLAVAVARQRATGVSTDEHWVVTARGQHEVAAQAAAALSGVQVLDRVHEAEVAGRDPYGQGGRTALVIAGAGALLLALIGIAVDVRATARRRVGEFAVLQTMGAGSRLLARAVLAEQGFLAGLGTLVGLGVGLGVAATLAPLLILTPTADRPEPPALLSVPWPSVLGTAAALFLAAMALSGVVAATLGRRLAVARLRIGDET